MAIRKIVSRSIGTDVIAAEDLAANSVTVAEITDGAVTEPKTNFGTSTDALKLPKGTAAQEPTAADYTGAVRYDTDKGVLTYSDGTQWYKVSAELAVLDSVSATIYAGAVGSDLTLTGSGFLTDDITVNFTQSSDGIDENVTVTPSSDTSATVSVPAAVYNNVTAGNVVTITVTNSDLSTSSPVNKTAVALPSGGDAITTSGNYRIHRFNSSGTFTNTISNLSVEYLIVAGGGAGGGNLSGGGGAGGMKESTATISSTGNTTITVGAGGGRVLGTQNGVTGGSGGNTSFGSIDSVLGGGGGGAGATPALPASGGSGGGASGYASGAGASGTAGQGNSGGNGGGGGGNYGGGGGGGKGASGQNGTNSDGGDGGVGATSSILGTSYYFAGGGGGGAYTDPGAAGNGGLGGGGGGGKDTASAGTGGGSALQTGGNGVVSGSAGVQVGGDGGLNTGGGGGGTSHAGGNWTYSGNGGKGICVIRYDVTAI